MLPLEALGSTVMFANAGPPPPDGISPCFSPAVEASQFWILTRSSSSKSSSERRSITLSLIGLPRVVVSLICHIPVVCQHINTGSVPTLVSASGNMQDVGRCPKPRILRVIRSSRIERIQSRWLLSLGMPRSPHANSHKSIQSV